MAEWYQDFFRGLGLAATGVTAGYATGGGPLAGLFGGIYGSVKAATGGASAGGDAYLRNVYQTAIPSAAAGLLLYPSNRAVQTQLAEINAEKKDYEQGVHPGFLDTLKFQTAELKGELADIASGTAGGLFGAGKEGYGAIGAAGNWLGDVVKGTGKGIGGFLEKGGLASNGMPLWLAALQKGGRDAYNALPGFGIGGPTILTPGGGGGTPTGSQVVPIPMPGGSTNNLPPPVLASFGGMGTVLLIGAALYLFLGKGVKLR